MTVPPAMPVAPVSVDESCTVSLIEPVDFDSSVASVGPAFPTTSCSEVQGLFAGWLMESPEYDACQ